LLLVDSPVAPGTPQVHSNVLYGNDPYDAVVDRSSDISGTNNYWGTNIGVDILAQVFDYYDDGARGRLLYIPFLQDPDPDAPVPPPRNLRAMFDGNSVALNWDAVPSTTTGYGYKVYYGIGIPGPPYVGTGIVQGDSPIDVGNVTTYALSGLSSGVHYFAVATYDTHGRLSWYSNEANVNPLGSVFLPLVRK
jgi:hypothetical protein